MTRYGAYVWTASSAGWFVLTYLTHLPELRHRLRHLRVRLDELGIRPPVNPKAGDVLSPGHFPSMSTPRRNTNKPNFHRSIHMVMTR